MLCGGGAGIDRIPILVGVDIDVVIVIVVVFVSVVVRLSWYIAVNTECYHGFCNAHGVVTCISVDVVVILGSIDFAVFVVAMYTVFCYHTLLS